MAKGTVTYQEEGGIHLLEFHLPTTGTTPVLIALAAASIIVILLAVLCLKTCGALCRAAKNCICPCSTWCIKDQGAKIEEPETQNELPFAVPKKLEPSENAYPLVPMQQK